MEKPKAESITAKEPAAHTNCDTHSSKPLSVLGLLIMFIISSPRVLAPRWREGTYGTVAVAGWPEPGRMLVCSADRALPPGPHSAWDAMELSRPSDLIRRPAATLAGSKPATPVFPETLATLSPSPFSLHATQRQPRSGGDGHGGRGGEDEAAPSRLARRCARSPVGERAAVKLAMDGALLSSPRACASASRRRAAERPIPRPDEASCAGLSRTRAAGCGSVQVSTHRPLL